MRPYWWPVTLEEPCQAQLVTEATVRAQCSAELGSTSPGAVIEVTADPEPVAVDEGLGMHPHSMVLVREGGHLRVSGAVAFGYEDDIDVRAVVTDAGDEELLAQAATFSPRAGPSAASVSVDCNGLAPGDYDLAVQVGPMFKLREHFEYTLRICPEPEPVRFGAQYSSLAHPAPVYTSIDQTTGWDNLWGESPLRDVVVSFPDRDQRFVFWRGTSYVPCWALPNAWLTYEWLEAEPDFNGAVGCVEPIMDKQCKYSRVKIIESSPARAVVHWRYALTDLNCKIIKDEWADEYFYLYPDAVGTRKLVAWMEGWAWHENQEFIVLNRPGGRPWQAVDPQAVTFMNTAGDEIRPVWPCPRFDVPGDWPDHIAKVNFRDQPDPFQAIASDYAQIKVWADPYLDKPGLLNSYLHWPVSQGIRTTWIDDEGDFERPTHSNLVNIVNDPDVREEKFRTWTWLIGLAPEDARLREVVHSWLHPPEIAATGLLGVRYDRDQRAWVMTAQPGRRDARITVAASPENPVINPAFVIEKWHGDADVSVVGSDAMVMTGRERDGRDLVVWVRGRFAEPFEVSLRHSP